MRRWARLLPLLPLLGTPAVLMWKAMSPNSYHLVLMVAGAVWAILNGSVMDPGVLGDGAGKSNGQAGYSELTCMALAMVVSASIAVGLWLLPGCSAAMRARERAVELQLARDCQDVEDAGLAPGWVKLACDLEETTVLLTVPESMWRDACAITMTSADAGPQ